MNRGALLLLVVALVLVGLAGRCVERGAHPSSRPPPALVQPETVHVSLGAPETCDGTGCRVDEHLVVRSEYVIAYDPDHHGPRWVSWRLRRSDFGTTRRHKGSFVTDTSLPSAWGYRVTHADFTNSGYQRGHLLPSEERTSTREANDLTFLLSNVEPQTAALNDGPWRDLERRCRTLAEREGHQLAVMAGPIFGAAPRTIGHEVPVPEAFWKVVVVQAEGEGPADIRDDTAVLAAVMPNVEGIVHIRWEEYAATVRAVQKRARLRLFSRVPEAHRRELEAQ